MILLQRKLEKIHQRSFAYMVGNGTAGIYCCLKAAGLKNAMVGIPSSVCMNVVLAVKYSGNQPVYLDISKRNLGLAPESLERCKQKLQAVIAVHAYGVACSIEKISSFCRANKIFLIEDLAVAQGATVSGKPVGCFGDVSIVSFGSGKIIDVGHGGAVLADDKDLLKEVMRIEHGLQNYCKSEVKRIASLGRYFTQFYNDHYGGNSPLFSDDFNNTAMKTKDAFLVRFDSSYTERIRQAVDSLEQNMANRRKKGEILTDKFTENGIDCFEPPDSSVIWRYNIFLEKQKRASILRRLLQKKYKVSSWFPSIDLFFERGREMLVNTPVSDWVGDSILNIWVNDEIDEVYLENVSNEIIQAVA